MLGTVQAEIVEAVDAVMRQEFGRLRPFDDQLVHVVGLIEQYGALPPGDLFTAPIAEFGRDHRVDIVPGLGMAQQVHRIAGLRDSG